MSLCIILAIQRVYRKYNLHILCIFIFSSNCAKVFTYTKVLYLETYQPSYKKNLNYHFHIKKNTV